MFFIAFKVRITLLMKNYVNMKIFLMRDMKTSTNWFNPEHWNSIPQTGTDWPGKIETVGMFAKTSNNKHDWDHAKYMNILHQNRTQKQLQYFFLIYCKNLTNFLFWVLWTYLLKSKIDNPTCWSFDLGEHHKELQS